MYFDSMDTVGKRVRKKKAAKKKVSAEKELQKTLPKKPSSPQRPDLNTDEMKLARMLLSSALGDFQVEDTSETVHMEMGMGMDKRLEKGINSAQNLAADMFFHPKLRGDDEMVDPPRVH